MILGGVLVTGGAGFIGSRLIRRILPLCKHIYVIDDLSTGKRAAIPSSPKITFIKGSITNRELLQAVMPKVEYIFHLACTNIMKSVHDIDLDFQTNLYGGHLVLQNAHKHCRNLKRIIYTSTTSIYSDAAALPTNESYYNIKLPYPASKFSTEHYCDVYYNMFQLPVTVLRLSNVYGPGQTSTNPYCGVVAKFFEAALKRKNMIIFGDGKQTRDFTYIEDALEALVLASLREEGIGQVYNVGTGIETSILELAQLIKEITQYKDGVIEFMPKRPIDIVERRNIDSSKIQREIKWNAGFSLIEGLKGTFQWLKGELL